MTIQEVKNIIGFDKDTPFYTSLNGIIDCTYKIALKEGKSEEEAVQTALKRLEKEINELKQ